jgi:molybdopterin/thiamine biosynthesis adenylyltransferase
MKLKDYSRIEKAVDLNLLAKTHVVAVGAGGAFSLYDAIARTGIGKLTVVDFDEVEESNIVRQGYLTGDIGKKKVDALGEHLKKVNSGMLYQGITKNILVKKDHELHNVFQGAAIFLFLTDSFEAQSFGNRLSLIYQVPAIWAGYYERSHCAEIVFTIPGVTPSCFRCAVSPRYEAQRNSKEEIKASSNSNTIFHSMLLDSYIGMLLLAILHNKTNGYEYSGWFGNYWDRNLIQLKVNPQYGNDPESLFSRTFAQTSGRAFNFNSVWQKIEPEIPPKYKSCPDCKGRPYVEALHGFGRSEYYRLDLHKDTVEDHMMPWKGGYDHLKEERNGKS